MKKMFLGLMAAGMLMACHQNQTAGANAAVKGTNVSVANPNAPVIKFAEESYSFGKIKQGDSVMHDYKFVNTGKSPLIITDAVATCGCTKPVWPKEPIQPNASGVIKVTFHSEGKSGLQDKMITVTGNTTPAQNMVHLVGEVLEKK